MSGSSVPPFCPAPLSFSEPLPEYLDRCRREILDEPVGRRDDRRRLHFVIGNEAGDADSIVSAVAHAYLSSASAAPINREGAGGGAEDLCGYGDCLVVPVVPITRADLAGNRPETLHLLRTLAGVPLDRLLYVDEWRRFLKGMERGGRQLHGASLTPRARAEPSRPRVLLTLVDHNRFDASRLKEPSAGGGGGDGTVDFEVVRILDHHRDERRHLGSCPPGSYRRTVAFDEASGRALVASACTLVVEHWVRQARQAPAGTGPACDQEGEAGASQTDLRPVLPASLSILLLGTILLDSVNLDPRAGKVTDRDRDAVRALLSRTDWSQLSEEARAALGAGASVAPPDPSALFDALQSSKFDARFWASLSVRDALRLDYKQFRADRSTDGPVARHFVLGLSTVLLSVRDFVSKVNFLEEVGEYMRLHGLDVLVVTMATSSKSENAGETGSANLQRQLILCDLEGGTLVRGLVEHLFRPEVQPALQLAVVTDTITSDTASGSGNLYVRAFDQGNAKASRKAVAPLVIDYFESSRI